MNSFFFSKALVLQDFSGEEKTCRVHKNILLNILSRSVEKQISFNVVSG